MADPKRSSKNSPYTFFISHESLLAKSDSLFPMSSRKSRTKQRALIEPTGNTHVAPNIPSYFRQLRMFSSRCEDQNVQPH